jgi:UPF0042 nucleotide-binding protein
MGVPSADLVVVTGMTGAGRSTAAKALEDQGRFVIDNLPPRLLPEVVRLVGTDSFEASRLAVVVDVRSRGFFTDLAGALDELRGTGVRTQVLFLEASNDVLVRRQEAARRPHPLQGGARLLDGILRERELLRDLRGTADLLVDTSNLNVHELVNRLEALFLETGTPSLRATVVSFGFKYGIPVDADMVVDMRFLPNPHWDPDLQPLNGLDSSVRDYVLRQPAAQSFLDRFDALLESVEAGFRAERKHYLNIAVGCTGGKHRSVAMGEEIGRRLGVRGVETTVVHRDLGRE